MGKVSRTVLFNLAVIVVAALTLWRGYVVHDSSFFTLSKLSDELEVGANVSYIWNGGALSRVVFNVRVHVPNPSQLLPLKVKYVALKGGVVTLGGVPLLYSRPQNVQLEELIEPGGERELTFSITLSERRDLSKVEELLKGGETSWRLDFTILVETAHVRGFVRRVVIVSNTYKN